MSHCTVVVILLVLACFRMSKSTIERARYNGDIYILSPDKLGTMGNPMPDKHDHIDNDDDDNDDDEDDSVAKNSKVQNVTHLAESSIYDEKLIDMEAVMHECNTSFVTSIPDLMHFNATGSLQDEKDKTSMCYMRCFFEKSGLLEDFKLNADLVRKYIWPATGDSLEYCQNEDKNEPNACIRAYTIIKCITLRAITDARNKPTV